MLEIMLLSNVCVKRIFVEPKLATWNEYHILFTLWGFWTWLIWFNNLGYSIKVALYIYVRTKWMILQ